MLGIQDAAEAAGSFGQHISQWKAQRQHNPIQYFTPGKRTFAGYFFGGDR